MNLSIDPLFSLSLSLRSRINLSPGVLFEQVNDASGCLNTSLMIFSFVMMRNDSRMSRSLLLVIVVWTEISSVIAPLNLHFDCLIYFHREEKFAYQHFSHLVEDFLPYCFRSSVEPFLNTVDRRFTFKELRDDRITVEDLLSWSASMELAEDYQFYLNEGNHSLSKRIFINCSDPWFGDQCQYAFPAIFGRSSIDQIIRWQFHGRSSRVSSDPLSCLSSWSCHRGGSNVCLDWREICDGHVDCLDDGIDELFCSEMEVHQCAENEYRCHNGQCIPRQFFSDDRDDPDCLDRSDEPVDLSYWNSCYQNPSFRCEEHACRPHGHTFACGDGQCVAKFDRCHNGRDQQWIESLSSSEHLPKRCAMLIRCLTIFITDRSCQSWIDEVKIDEYLDDCPSVIEYPRWPIHLGHLRLLYAKSDIEAFPRPSYVCFDAQLCDCLQPSYFHKNLTCLPGDFFDFHSSISGDPWIDLVFELNSHFSSCLRSLDPPSLFYLCRNSSKSIGEHRLADGNVDCCHHDDESSELTCSLSDRIHCSQSNVCLSSLFDETDCPEYQSEISFDRFCNGLEEYSFDDGHTDETECQYWPCQTIYSRCDGYWNCPRGEDEENCSANQRCPRGSHSCLSLVNGSSICLPGEEVNDGIDQCLGGSDEPQFCRQLYPNRRDYHRFHCSQSDLCLAMEDLCNRIRTCPQGDDEQFCEQDRPVCSEDLRTEREQILCQANEHPKKTLLPSSSPLTINSSWICNRGLSVFHRSSSVECLCPPSYFGRRCEHQSERISLTLELINTKRNEVYSLLILLVDDERIEFVDQFDFFPGQSCSMKFNRYLLYPSRPKNRSTICHVVVHLYEKSELISRFRASWSFSIPFAFLPVNRLSHLLAIPSLDTRQITCPPSLICLHGRCVKYANTDDFFCHCDSTWSGVRCDRRVICADCSPDSLCLGKVRQRSICLCPVNRLGSRCLLNVTCPLNACRNKGRCLRRTPTEYFCQCLEGFFGQRCQFSSTSVHLRFVRLDLPSYLLAYFLSTFADDSPSPPRWTIMIEKLTLFQHDITFRLSIDFDLVLIKLTDRFYLVDGDVLHPDRECPSVDRLFNASLHPYRRVKYFHRLCEDHRDLRCFYDERFFCLCTKERQANCRRFPSEKELQCSTANHCANDGKCLQDHRHCPSTVICLCPSCFFGDQCQFYAKDFGLTLDEILGYEIQRHRPLTEQTLPVKISLLITMLMFLIGTISGICSILTFSHPICQDTGCGMYLLSSSITSFFTVIVFTLKFIFLLLGQRWILVLNCFFVEPSLKILINLDHWFNGCVAIERAWTVFQGITFRKKTSQRLAKWMILLLVVVNLLVFIPHLSHLHLYDDQREQRTWCVVRYSSFIQFYNTLILFVQFFTPFLFNVFSAVFIIVGTARQRAKNDGYWRQLKRKFVQHKHLLISPILLILLMLPRLIISLKLNCQKSSKYFWWYLHGYFVSFLPSVLVFVVFVLPSSMFKKAFRQAMDKQKKRFLH